jgi:hypothetical protein
MKVIGHEAVGVNLPAGLFAGLSQGLQKAVAVEVIFEEGFAPVAAIHNVVDSARVLNSQFARHGPALCLKGRLCQ